MSETTITMKEAEQLRQDCNEAIERRKSLERLMNNSDFKKVFLDFYSDKEPARLVHLMAEPAFTTSDKRDIYLLDLKEQMIGIARFSAFIRTVMYMADKAQESLDALNQADIIN